MSSPMQIPWRKRIAPMGLTPSLAGEDRLRRLVDFGNNVKLRFPRQPDVFATFCETCSLCEEKGAEWVLEKLRGLFADHQDLITEFLELHLGVSAPVDGAGGSTDCELFSDMEKELAVLNTGEKPKVIEEEPRSSFPALVKNAHERVLFDCEDDMGNLDVMISVARSAMSRIVSFVAAGRGGDCSLTAGELRCIRRMYGDQGDAVVELMRAEPVQALPLVLSRLQQKHDEWVAYRSDARAVWKKAFAEHHRPSLGREDADTDTDTDNNAITITITVKALADVGSSTSCPSEKEQEEQKLFGRPMSWWEREAQKGKLPAAPIFAAEAKANADRCCP